MSNSKNIQIKHAQIKWSDQSEPFSKLFDDHYFNTDEGINESDCVFLQGSELNKRGLNCEKTSFVLQSPALEQFITSNPDKPLKQLIFSSFEKYPLNRNDLVKAVELWPRLAPYIKPLH